MKPMRWKKQYLSGNPVLDEQIQSLVSIFNESSQEATHKEHCQEFNELHQLCTQIIETQLLTVSAADKANSLHAYLPILQDTLNHNFPLATKSQSACRECGLCDDLRERLSNWVNAP